jgi:hypothetical protein
MFSWAQEGLAVLSGGAVGFSLGLIGGGGSILAVPLLLYVVDIDDPHVAIGTSALSVAANAFANLFGHWRAGNVKWSCAVTFALAGVVGAAIGSTLGKLVEGQQLLFLFALAMIAVGVAMLRPRAAAGDPDVRMEEMVLAGQIEEVARYCETDVLNTYRVWLVYELFRGSITAEQLAWSEGQVREFVANRKTANPHLEAAVGIVDQSHELNRPCEVRPIPSETRK